MADLAVKLTAPQWQLLVDIDTDGQFRCSDIYQPARRLTELGLIEKHTGGFGGTSFAMTEKGRALLDALKDEGEGR